MSAGQAESAAGSDPCLNLAILASPCCVWEHIKPFAAGGSKLSDNMCRMEAADRATYKTFKHKEHVRRMNLHTSDQSGKVSS